MDEEEDEYKLKPFDCFNNDMNLLVINILLEGFYRGKNIFTLDQFLKGNYWKMEEITTEITDTKDYGSVEIYVLHQIIQIIRDLNLGKVTRISVTDLYELTENVVREALNKKEYTEDDVMHYSGTLMEISSLGGIKNEQRGEFFRSLNAPRSASKMAHFRQKEAYSRHLVRTSS
ncbi:MAG: hypothetical protein ACKOW9_00855 [Candidatus Paceibacterota bacterium]